MTSERPSQPDAAQVFPTYVETTSPLIRGVRLYDERPLYGGQEAHRRAITTAPEVESTAPIRPFFERCSVPVRLFAVDLSTARESHQQGHTYLLVVLLVPLDGYDSVAAAQHSLDVYLARRLADEADWTVEFSARKVAPALRMTSQQVAQSIHAHRELENPLVEIEQGSTDTHGSIRWQATPRGALPLLAATDPDEEAPNS
jgi:hypothetical protein